ncbi:Nucleoside-diphosphate-sugar epimerase [Butyrivibrio proteoclasticus]|uniref:Nucleoside-diphosphate-sugar epimerase n=1 Tax=Butyrivibrio proteoclasticus TaxID=43305 RepID=A0A1I5R2B3_9FIRM|nr:NAD-dependent epimerase/dehydratase family protein [Butyrivibrio proteoclasticus]SFP52668.1 Nucleoside-diphosphate-sugar epimerase [Butyrivibrio proteoclasticus]
MDTLVVGSNGYFSKDSLETAFGADNIILCGQELESKKAGNIRWFKKSIMGDDFTTLFFTYGFERVVFVSHFINKDSYEVGEIEQLRNVLSLCRKSKVKQFVYITSDEALLDIENSDSIIYSSVESICRYYAEQYQISVKIIYSPHLISGHYKDDFWCRIFDSLERNEKVEIKAMGDEIADFLSVDDLAAFLKRMFDAWEEDEYSYGTYETIYLRSGASTTYEEAFSSIRKIYKMANVSYIGSSIKGRFDYGQDVARQFYGWFAKKDAVAEIENYVEEYRNNYHAKRKITEIIRDKLRLNGKIMMLVELILGAFLVEIYNYYSNGSVQFRMIDVRLLFVVLMALVYGTGVGGITAFIEILSLILAYYRQGTNGLLLFYDPSNWIPFILLLVAAAVCGYIKQSRDEERTFITDENKLLKEEKDFVNRLYEEAMEYKNQYKQDLIGSRDGFGRIFDVVKKLSTTVPEEIFAESIPVMEDVLDNRSIAIYTINDPNARFARLNVASEQISVKLKKSINLEDYSQVIEEVKKGEIWFNRDVREGYPTYVAGIKSDGVLSVLIMIYQVEYIQISTYYTNLIRILSGLMENFIIKAWEYQKVVADKTYVEGTQIAKYDYFIQQFKIQKEMADNKLTDFRLFRIMRENRTIMEIDEMLQTKIRNNDIVGLGRDNNIYLLASQVDESSESIVLKRFRNMGLKCDVVESVG